MVFTRKDGDFHGQAVSLPEGSFVNIEMKVPKSHGKARAAFNVMDTSLWGFFVILCLLVNLSTFLAGGQFTIELRGKLVKHIPNHHIPGNSAIVPFDGE